MKLDEFRMSAIGQRSEAFTKKAIAPERLLGLDRSIEPGRREPGRAADRAPHVGLVGIPHVDRDFRQRSPRRVRSAFMELLECRIEGQVASRVA